MLLHIWERTAQSMAVLKKNGFYPGLSGTLQDEELESLVAFQPSYSLCHAVPSNLLFTSALELCMSCKVSVILISLWARYLLSRTLLL